MRAAVGQELLLAVRLGAGDDMPGGTTVEDSVRACQLLEQAGVDLLDISGGFCGAPTGAAARSRAISAIGARQLRRRCPCRCWSQEGLPSQRLPAACWKRARQTLSAWAGRC